MSATIVLPLPTSLKQAVHLESRDGILTYLAYDAFLRRSEFEWQTVVVEVVEELSHAREEKSVAAAHALRTLCLYR